MRYYNSSLITCTFADICCWTWKTLLLNLVVRIMSMSYYVHLYLCHDLRYSNSHSSSSASKLEITCAMIFLLLASLCWGRDAGVPEQVWVRFQQQMVRLQRRASLPVASFPVTALRFSWPSLWLRESWRQWITYWCELWLLHISGYYQICAI